MEKLDFEVLLKEHNFKQMIYSCKRKREILASGKYKGYKFYILNLGAFPTAYVEIPKTHKFYMKHYDEIDIDVHGGLTYSEDFLEISETKGIGGSWFIGWDYAHFEDYIGFEEIYPSDFRTGSKKWTTQEILQEVFYVIDQLERKEYEN